MYKNLIWLYVRKLTSNTVMLFVRMYISHKCGTILNSKYKFDFELCFGDKNNQHAQIERNLFLNKIESFLKFKV